MNLDYFITAVWGTAVMVIWLQSSFATVMIVRLGLGLSRLLWGIASAFNAQAASDELERQADKIRERAEQTRET
jgi:hypothetical protein